MAHADPSGAKKRSTCKTKSTLDEDVFVWLWSSTRSFSVGYRPTTENRRKSIEGHTFKFCLCFKSPETVVSSRRDPCRAKLVGPQDFPRPIWAWQISTGVETCLLQTSTVYSATTLRQCQRDISIPSNNTQKTPLQLVSRVLPRYVYKCRVWKARSGRIRRRVSCND